MKRIYMFLFAVLTVCLSVGAQVLPTFSTEDDPVWYYVQFYTGSAYLEDQGSGYNILTASKEDSDAQKWQFIGTQSSFVMKSKLGNYVYYTSSYFKTNSSNKTTLKIVQSTNSSASTYWEIQRSSSSNSMNQWGGAGTGKSLGEWTAGDTNNPLTFLPASVSLPTFSDDENETWYFIQFNNGGYTLQDNGEGECIRTATADPIDAQLWKLVGTQDNFQLVNKLGRYAVVSSTASTSESPSNSTPLRASTTAYSAGYSLIETTNSTYSPAWEICPNAYSGQSLNQWGGSSVGRSIGVWSSADNNNPVTFISPDDMTYADFNVVGTTTYTPSNNLTLWYDQPATRTGVSNTWMEYSLPIGNGQFGASLFGGIAKDEIQFNEKSLWSGSSTDNGSEYGDYENFGSVYVEDISGEIGYGSDAAAQEYYRQLDLTNATGTVSYKSPDGATTYTRQYIASYPAQAVLAHYAADQAGKLSLRFTLESGSPGISATTSYSEGEGTFSGKLETISYNARIKVVASGDNAAVTTTDEGITVQNADEVLLILAGATDFDAYSSTYVSNTSALASTVSARINDAAAKSWSELYAEHVEDYKTYFDRVSFTLTDAANDVTTNELVDQYTDDLETGTETFALKLEQLYFNYGRYLEISSSRGVDLPSNLQGIWNNSSEAPWNSDIHSNINVQMNYWPAEPTNLSEMHVPFLNYITNMAMNHGQWASYAKAAGQKYGWTCYTENNIFGGVGSFMHNYVIANAWYVTHLWQHYRYTLDTEFLQGAFPTMWTASQFWIDRLVLDTDGTYVCPDEYSPEHGPSAEDGVAHAQQLVWELFSNTLDAAEVLGDACGVSADSLAILTDRFEKLDKGLAIETYTGDWGSTLNGVSTGDELLREWKTSAFSAGSSGHRHMSHLMCLYPFAQVTPSSPYFNAAVNSMLLRGDSSTGWSMGWKINLWARAHDGDHAHTVLALALNHSTSYSTNQYAGGIYYNLYDSHAPFQIDGNFGACAGIAEMLMQSITDTIQILPALPSVWANGSVTGLKAVGDFTVSITWEEGLPVSVTVVNNQGQPGVINCQGIVGATCMVDGVETELEVVGTNLVNLPATKGSTTVFTIDHSVGIDNVTSADAASKFSVAGRTVSYTGAVKAMRVSDLQGRVINETTKSSVTVSQNAGPMVIVDVTDSEGKTHSQSVVLQ